MMPSMTLKNKNIKKNIFQDFRWSTTEFIRTAETVQGLGQYSKIVIFGSRQFLYTVTIRDEENVTQLTCLSPKRTYLNAKEAALTWTRTSDFPALSYPWLWTLCPHVAKENTVH